MNDWREKLVEATHGKIVELELIGLDGNAFFLMGSFQKQAKKEKWTSQEIKAVLDECTSGDYDHLLNTLMVVCCDPETTDDEE